MKRIVMLLFAALSLTMASAQPSAVKKSANSVFTLTTYDKNGEEIATAHGVFVGTDGEAISAWKPFVGAARAEVTDMKGQKHNVETMMGANELYDVCKFRVAGKVVPMLSARAPQTDGAKVWLVNNVNRKAKVQPLTIEKNERFMQKYSYYIFTDKVEDDVDGCAVVDNSGALLAILQLSQAGTEAHGTDAMFTDSLKTNGMSCNDPVLKQTGIRIDMPRDKEQAQLLLMMTGETNTDSLQRARYIDDFISLYPKAVDGYVARAQKLMASNDYDGAEREMALAVKNVENKADAHAEWSRMMYQKLMLAPDSTFTKWTLDDAMAEIQKAYAIDPQPAYRHSEAQIVFSKADYAKAYDMFMELANGKMRNGEVFYEAAQCKTQLKAPTTEIIALLDSAVAACPQPLTNLSAPYILARGQVLDANGQHRLALKDYNTYDTLMMGRANATFYYMRYQCEMKVRQYKQALNDIAHAALLSPGQPLYIAELASLQLRVNQYEDAIKAADLCLKYAPDNSDSYIIKGLALIQLKKNAEGLAALQKAKELGDTRADELIKKYK